MGLSPADTLQQHEGWPSLGNTHQASIHLLRDSLSMKATMRGMVSEALHLQLAGHADNRMKAAAHLQLEAVRRAAAQMAHRKRILLTYAEQLTNPTAQEHMLRLIHYHTVHDPDIH